MVSLLREVDDRSTFSAATPHFFKIILEDTLRDSKLKIPKKFVRKYGEYLSSPVYLKLPNGSEWRVELKKCDDEAWFENGWPQFSEVYSLDCCHWLVFGYEGNSKFQVCIFDRSATEIDYPINCDRPADIHGEPTMPKMMEATQDDVSVEILEDFPPSTKTRDKSPLDDASVETLEEFLPTPKTREKSPLNDDSVEILEDFPPSPKPREKSPLPCPRPSKNNRISFSKAESNINLQNVIPHIGPRNTQPYEMMFEKSTNNKYSHWPKTEINGEDDFDAEKDGGGSSSTQRFVKRRRDQVLGKMHSLNKSEKAKAIEKTNAFQSENPYFKVAMQPSYINRSFLWFPSGFAKRHLKQSAGNVILGVSNETRTWSVNFKYKKPRAQFQYGWLKFVMGNNLKVGDVCVFMLINKTKLLFEVFIFRTTEAANLPFSPGHGRGALIDQVKKERNPINKVESDCTTTNQVKVEIGKYKMRKNGGQVIERPSSLSALEAANKFVPTNPFFKLNAGSAWRLSKVHVPNTFSKSYIKEKKKQTAILQVRDRSWPVNLVADRQSRFRIYGGWPAFANENSLSKGDVCIFELIELNDMVLKVHIFRDHDYAK